MKSFSPHLHLFFLSLILVTLQACNGGEEMTENPEDDTPTIPVEVSNVSRGDISAYYSNTATLEAEQEATVVSKVRGIIEELYVEEGDRVQAGQVIAKIEDEQYQIEADRAKATLDRLYNDFQRNKELFERELISAEAFQNSQYEYESQKATYDLAALNLEYTSVRSPISGVISERFVKAGNMIGTDQQMYRVTDFSPLQAVLHIPEHEMAKIRNDQRAELRVDALPNETFVGHVERISPVVDSETGTFKVTIYVDETRDMLRPGMFGRVKIVYDTRENTRMIPKSAVISEDLAESVYVIKDSLAFKKEIQTGYTNGSNVEIINGLEDGEMVVTIGQGSLQDSSKVSVIESL
ncbi:efflux RND transporter periplasmic adaptor subunit [Rhodohalobacter sulfatireducens]|uniref:Efflux RND transporter periplasmic adaptor subunit n=1 Tax=Rhodohalobacter sulfatireducens TaxID=2911366 RepID=A0ABS9K8N8_9BACT|nr:efflux RND transporter periplasmic adaptor subunit [Rhodohalobacter sulfatireducens]MCG2587201.1 efflux RND transporter periplasmic adaptor subunit [Rhodohalobacter sulfatireducens]